jgi:hypothetical protein
MNCVCIFFSPSTGIQEEEDSCELGKQDLYQLNQWIQVRIFFISVSAYYFSHVYYLLGSSYPRTSIRNEIRIVAAYCERYS